MIIAQAPDEMLQEIGDGFLLVISLIDATTKDIRNVHCALSRAEARLPFPVLATRFLQPAMSALTATAPAPPAPITATA